MLRFLRQFRKNLLGSGKMTKYLFYALGEIFLVVLGILIALQINNWNEERKLETKRQDYYQQLLEDLNKDKVYINNTISKFESQRESYRQYLEKFSKSKMSRESMYNSLLNLNMESYALNFNTSTIESLQNSGEIVLIPPELRNRLIDLKRNQERIARDESLDNRGKTGIAERISLVLGAISLEGRLKGQAELKSSLNIDQKLNEKILGLEAIQDWMDFSENKSIRELKDLVNEINEVEVLIKDEVKTK